MWIDRLAPYYASELKNAGVIAITPAGNLYEQGLYGFKEFTSNVPNIAAFLSSAAQWYGVFDQLDTVFQPNIYDSLSEVRETQCEPASGLLSIFNNANSLNNIFLPSFIDSINNPLTSNEIQPWSCLFKDNSLVDTSIERLNTANSFTDGYGILILTGETDDLVNAELENKTANTLCHQGTPIQHVTCKNSDHTEVAATSLNMTLQFMKDRLEGKPFIGGACVDAEIINCN